MLQVLGLFGHCLFRVVFDFGLHLRQLLLQGLFSFCKGALEQTYFRLATNLLLLVVNYDLSDFLFQMVHESFLAFELLGQSRIFIQECLTFSLHRIELLLDLLERVACSSKDLLALPEVGNLLL